MFTKVILWLFVLNLGVVCGAGLYEARISVPRWMDASSEVGPRWRPDEAHRDDVGRRFWAFTTTVPLTLLTVLNLWLAWRSSGEIRAWWLAAGAAALGDRLFTFAYFIPRMVRLMGMPDSPEARAGIAQWSHLSGLRQLLILVAWVTAIHSLGLLYRSRS